jgi:hypothetical protein
MSSMKTGTAGDTAIYDSLGRIQRGFEEILGELELLQQHKAFRDRRLIKAAVVAVRETQAGTLFEILEVLHEREEHEWTRFARQRKRLEEGQP